MEKHVCPWYIGYILASPIRKLFQNPEKILKPDIKPGMRVLEVGPGMGFFRTTGENLLEMEDEVYCIDLQEKMLKSL